MHTQPSSTVHIVGGDGFVHAMNKTERLKGEASSLLLAIDSHHCLTITITPGGDTLKGKVKSSLSELMSRIQLNTDLELNKDLWWFCIQQTFTINHQNNLRDKSVLCKVNLF